MITFSEKLPDPKELEKELGDFLAKKFGGSVKLAAPIAMPLLESDGKAEKRAEAPWTPEFNLKPDELIAYLDQYIVKQDSAKAILATKICTHFNRIRFRQSSPDSVRDMVGSIKNNILMLGPTGVGKTYLVRLIAHKIGVPFVKGDATKFSETGYVGGDVEDLVRDLVREADGDIEKAQYGIIYIDEIDKIASARNLVGADVSRTGVQRALLKPMEETEVDLKVPHDPISMLQEIERFRKTGQRDQSTVNTRNILFIMSGAFSGLDAIIKKRLTEKAIGFGATFTRVAETAEILSRVKSEDLIEYGFESEFVGRLPVRAIFEHLSEVDLFTILSNPNNPIVLGKKLDFAAYGITVKFGASALKHLAGRAFSENTGARGLVSAVEHALLNFEKRLPSTKVRRFAVSDDVVTHPDQWLKKLEENPDHPEMAEIFSRIRSQEHQALVDYVTENTTHLCNRFGLSLTDARIDLIADYFADHTTDINGVFEKITEFCEQIKSIEMQFLKNYGINIVFEDDAIDHILIQWRNGNVNLDEFYKQLSDNLEYGLKLVREKTGRNRFFLTSQALEAPEVFIHQMLKEVQAPSDPHLPAGGLETP
ncbi:MAG: AAA domain-containing protein [Desulfatitalea sp.]|nr:AAA family ATPase [Desulfatitalea sp.]NNK02328.1 AAA domain-containing protein [Desulfatitalea sp.]